ncbi:DUF6636 domain-containing protein [Alloyangia pacifica]|uniref:DUF6636 domain-containing protein n=1 Tax=Alloyangia pacifica TaxID=311180 RepID=UPI001CD3AB9A|nr:DUF6636 domain-containing protein [Alloyangia pacifica]MCA0996997.1 hypothetical protein [Alloyangia pacifica]
MSLAHRRLRFCLPVAQPFPNGLLIFLLPLFALPLAALLPAPARADVFPFNTPSGNISCSVGIERDGTDIMCSINEKQGTPPLPRPASCAGAWGHHFEMLDRGPVTAKCGAGWPKETKPETNAMPYGHIEDFGGITCSSSKQGLECRNRDGHGFLLSRRVLKVW